MSIGVVKLIETESRMLGAGGEGRMESYYLLVTELQFRKMKKSSEDYEGVRDKV